MYVSKWTEIGKYSWVICFFTIDDVLKEFTGENSYWSNKLVNHTQYLSAHFIIKSVYKLTNLQFCKFVLGNYIEVLGVLRFVTKCENIILTSGRIIKKSKAIICRPPYIGAGQYINPKRFYEFAEYIWVMKSWISHLGRVSELAFDPVKQTYRGVNMFQQRIHISDGRCAHIFRVQFGTWIIS